MRHLMRAEYEEDRRDAVRTWHMVRGDEHVAMCGRVLRADADTLPEDSWGGTAEPDCHSCGALYLREVP
ncbi:hypothetical protein [Streptomyces marincola]|uniref:Uncharacterized protein n=1 Tax=Streptomyces marincola TaxID=2878388 RepID=A0A1W7CX65_9ACTN|nr:hypothetical protein [Streptomyces marincola]ARQ69403.1 hypothetical protein CAG99_11455 [Streptomyces marincola]UCM89516.1 hypothetical protein LC193_17055 [Streptomyces marincola]